MEDVIIVIIMILPFILVGILVTRRSRRSRRR